MVAEPMGQDEEYAGVKNSVRSTGAPIREGEENLLEDEEI